MDGVMPFRQRAVDVHHPQSADLEAAPLEPTDDFPDEAALDPIGLHDDECLLQVVPFGVLWTRDRTPATRASSPRTASRSADRSAIALKTRSPSPQRYTE